MLIGVLIPTLIDWDLCLKDVDFDSNLRDHIMYIRICTHARKPCSGAYIRIVESSVVYSVDTIDYR